MKFLPIIFFLIFSCAHKTPVQKTVAYRCGHLYDSGNVNWKSNQVLIVRDGKIVDVNPKRIPGDVEVVDLSDRWIIPGLIDAHTHVFLTDPTRGEDFSRGLYEFVTKTNDQTREVMGHVRLQSLLRSGFTSVRDLGNQGDVQHSEQADEPHFFSSGSGFAPGIGQFPPGTPEAIVRKEYRKLSGNFPEDFLSPVLKLYADEEPNISFADLATLQSWTRSAHEHKIPVAVHAILSKGIDLAIASGADTLEHGTEIKEKQLEAMKKKNMIFVPTYASILYHDEAEARKICSAIRSAEILGVRIAFGSDNYFTFSDFGKETLEILLSYHACGLSPKQIINAATVESARTLRIEALTGQLTSGSFADFIVLKKNVLENMDELRRPEAIYKNGQKITP